MRMSPMKGLFHAGLLVGATWVVPLIASASPVQDRIEADIEHGRPVVVHITVALADNDNQWIAPVPAALGDGQDPDRNLYWGARYGVKHFLIKDGGWAPVNAGGIVGSPVLERLVLKKTFERHGRPAPVYLVADAWDGAYIGDAIRQFLRYSAGHDRAVLKPGNKTRIEAGGGAHAQVYIGHNALMDYLGMRDRALANPDAAEDRPANDVIVLACESRPYFRTRLEALGAHPLLMTTGLMAPEAYTLDATIAAWIAGATENQIRQAAAGAYARYQKASLPAVEKLFGLQ
jgi:hypothetical protein